MVKITLDTFNRCSEKLTQKQSAIGLLEHVLADQKEIEIALTIGGLINPDMLRGFLVAYLCIETQQKQSETAALEEIYRKES